MTGDANSIGGQIRVLLNSNSNSPTLEASTVHLWHLNFHLAQPMAPLSRSYIPEQTTG